MGSVSASEKDIASSSAVSAPPAQPHPSPWQSPVPYLFGGLAAVLCIILFSLLMLAFSYRRQSARRNGPARTQLGGAAQKQGESGMAESVHVFEQKILVIMAGDEHPTYLATPVSSLGEGFEEVFGKGDDNRENSQKIDEQVCDLVATSTTTPLENEGALESRQSSNL